MARNYTRKIESEDGTQKMCTKYLVMKNLNEFAFRNKSADKLHFWCKLCHAACNIAVNEKCKIEVMSHYSNGPPKCACCNESEIMFMTIDHINNDGAEHRKKDKLGAGSSTYYWLKKNNYPEGFQVLCWNCQRPKAIGKICPHQIKKEKQ